MLCKKLGAMKKNLIIIAALLFALAPAPRLMSRAGLSSEVKIVNGMPALYVNGVLTSQTLAAPYRPGPADFNDFRQAGISMFNIYLRFDWTAPETYDFKKIDDKLDGYLKIDPKALFLPRVLLTPGSWWCKSFPSEITMRDDGSPAGMFGQPCHPSMASEKYRELSHKAMNAFLNHVEGKYGDNIVGYQVGNGFGGEWLMFNSFWETRPGRRTAHEIRRRGLLAPRPGAFKAWLRKNTRRLSRRSAAPGDDRDGHLRDRRRRRTKSSATAAPTASSSTPASAPRAGFLPFFNEMVGGRPDRELPVGQGSSRTGRRSSAPSTVTFGATSRT